MFGPLHHKEKKLLCLGKNKKKKQNQKRVDRLLGRFKNVAQASKIKGKPGKTLTGIKKALGNPDEIIYNESVRRVYLGENFRL